MSMSRRSFAVVLVALCVLVVVLTAIHLAELPLRIPLNYNEG